MSTLTKTDSPRPEWLDQVAAFVGRHFEVREAVRRNICLRAMLDQTDPVDNGVLSLSLFEGGWHETLTDLIVAARRDFIRVTVDWSGHYLWADFTFGGGVVRVWEPNGTTATSGAVYALATCPIEELDALLARCVELRERGL